MQYHHATAGGIRKPLIRDEVWKFLAIIILKSHKIINGLRCKTTEGILRGKITEDNRSYKALACY